jgi:hypothetical protein
MKTLMDKIIAFEKTAATVKEFNEIFAVKLEGFDPTLEVEIGELADTDTTRFLTVGKNIVKHNFTVCNLVEDYTESGWYPEEKTYREDKRRHQRFN